VSDHLYRIADMVGTFRDTLTSVIDLYMSSVSNRLNRVVNRLTVITLAFGFFAVITGFYGMNFEHTWPPFQSNWGVPFVLILMGLVAFVVFFVLKRIDDL
jgi:magnesium transporter